MLISQLNHLTRKKQIDFIRINLNFLLSRVQSENNFYDYKTIDVYNNEDSSMAN